MTAIAKFQVNLFCENVDRCAALYRQLGLPEAFRFPSTVPTEHVEVEAAGMRIGLTSAAVANKLADLGVTGAPMPPRSGHPGGAQFGKSVGAWAACRGAECHRSALDFPLGCDPAVENET